MDIYISNNLSAIRYFYSILLIVMDLSDAIEHIRTAKKISKADMARALEMDSSYYVKFEKRGKKLSIEQLEAIAGALKVSVLQLLTWGEGQEPVVSNAEEVAQLQKENEELKKRVKELEQAVRDKDKIDTLFAKQYQKQQVWLMNYFRFHVYQAALDLNMSDGLTNYFEVSNLYSKWGKEGLTKLFREKLCRNPFIYQMLDKGLYIDHQQFEDVLEEYQQDLYINNQSWEDFLKKEYK